MLDALTAPRSARTASMVLLCSLALACDPVPRDAFRPGGAAPIPTGVIQGDVLYVGGPPACRRAIPEDPTSEPVEIIGAVVLTLFAYENPPPPSGSATSALSALTVPGDQLFTLSDCDATGVLMRSAPYTWPEIPLGDGACEDDGTGALAPCVGRDYQIRAFYDRDMDFNPFFSIRNQPTQGDVGGGAFVDISADPPIPRRVQFGHQRLRPDGQVVPGVAVTLGAPLDTERPIFEVDETVTRALDSTTQLSRLTDSLAREDETAARSPFAVRALTDGGAAVSQEWRDALTAAGLGDFRFDAPDYSFYFRPVDGNLDGIIDPHPVLGSAGISWFYPVIILRRAKNPIEIAAGIPDVLLIASIRVTLPLGFRTMFTPREAVTQFDILVPPVAVMATNPREPALCRIPLIPPPEPGGTTLDRYFGDGVRWVDCQPVPSGNYDINLLGGIAGGIAGTAHEACMARCLAGFLSPTEMDRMMCVASCDFEAPLNSTTGFNIAFGQYSSQSWAIPNELGCPDVLYRGAAAINQLDPPREDGSFPDCSDPEQTLMLASQSREAGYAVTDAADFSFPATSDTDVGHGFPACQSSEGMPVTYADILAAPAPVAGREGLTGRGYVELCCPANVTRLCGLPLCEPRSTADPEFPVEAVRAGMDGSRDVRELRVEGVDYTRGADGTITPLCTPFRPPVLCCQVAAGM